MAAGGDVGGSNVCRFYTYPFITRRNRLGFCVEYLYGLFHAWIWEKPTGKAANGHDHTNYFLMKIAMAKRGTVLNRCLKEEFKEGGWQR